MHGKCKRCSGDLSIRSNGSWGGKPRQKRYCPVCERTRIAKYGDTVQASKRAWNHRNAEKRKAHKAVEKALASGDLQRAPCEICGAVAQAHHDDYEKPLDVRWLCAHHHSAHSSNEAHHGSRAASILICASSLDLGRFS